MGPPRSLRSLPPEGALSRLGSGPAPTDSRARAGDELLRVEDLEVHFPVTKGVLFKRTIGSVRAVDGVSFTIGRGETLGLVGESGCGKTTTSLAVLRMLPVSGGRIVFEGADVTQQDRSSGTFRRRMQMVYQDPYGSLDPRMRVRDIVGEPLTVHRVTSTRAEYDERVSGLLATVGLLPAMAERYPHEFSGGQRQRIAIARALALEPSLVICDEPVSALDVSIQAQVINVLMELQQRLQLSYLFVAHDLAVVRHISQRIAVMYLGRIVETADRDALFRDPLHPYTQALLSAVPVADPVAEQRRQRHVLRGEVPSVMRPPSGCHFHPRCPHAMEICREQAPVLTELSAGRAVACHLHTRATIPIKEVAAAS
jgi:oligopeptide transport system ATP-binding protein